MLFCPKCTETLHITDKRGIEIDFCPVCRGVWLDAGELEKIIERAIKTEMEYSDRSRLVDTFDDDYDDERRRKSDKKKYGKEYKKKHKRKHVLEEIFDIFD